MRHTLLYIAVLLAMVSCGQRRRPTATTAWEQLPVVAERVMLGGDTLIVCHPERMTDSIVLPLSHFIEELEIVRFESRDEAYVRPTSVRISDN